MMTKKIFPLIVLFSLALASQAQQIEQKKDGALRVMCYNVKHSRGMDNVIDHQRVADVINRIAPDIVTLQELDSATRRSDGAVTIKELGERTNMHYTFGGAIDFEGGRYGVGVLSKEKPLAHRSIPLPGREKRVLLLVEFANYYIGSTHFALEDSSILASIPIILDAVKDIVDKPLILGGDFNCGYDSQPQEMLQTKFTLLSDKDPVGGKRRVIDFIYGYSNGFSYDISAKMIVEERMASDHFPLFIDVGMARSRF